MSASVKWVQSECLSDGAVTICSVYTGIEGNTILPLVQDQAWWAHLLILSQFSMGKGSLDRKGNKKNVNLKKGNWGSLEHLATSAPPTPAQKLLEIIVPFMVLVCSQSTI